MPLVTNGGMESLGMYESAHPLIEVAQMSLRIASFFYPDYTVGTGITPVHAKMARGLHGLNHVTTDRELVT